MIIDAEGLSSIIDASVTLQVDPSTHGWAATYEITSGTKAYRVGYGVRSEVLRKTQLGPDGSLSMSMSRQSRCLLDRFIEGCR